MELKLCSACQQPYLTSAEFCPRCPPPVEPYTYNPDSWMNAGCVIAMLLFAFTLILLPLMFILGMLLSL